jgi:hypothetical protein
MKRYGGDITSSMKHRGISEEQWKSMKKDKQRELVGQWGIERGLVNK